MLVRKTCVLMASLCLLLTNMINAYGAEEWNPEDGLYPADEPIPYKFKNGYTCVQQSDGMIGWDIKLKKFGIEHNSATRHPIKVAITNINSYDPLLIGNMGDTKLEIGSYAHNTIWYLERTSNNNIIMWTLFAPNKQYGFNTPVLFSTKTYDMAGPVSFTTVYLCK